MRLVTAEEMMMIEKIAIEEMGIPSLILMENAALEVTGVCMKLLAHSPSPRAVIVAGAGNNGGDGIAAARQLYARNLDVELVYIGDSANATSDNKLNLDMAMELDIPVIFVHEPDDLDSAWNALWRAHLVVDAIFGTGLHSPVKGLQEEMIETMNRCGKPIVAVDIPSGLHADSGEVLGASVKAEVTVALGFYKQGNFAGQAREYCGKVVLGNISIPQKTGARIPQSAVTYEKKDIKAMLPKRPIRSNKGTFGKVLVIAGSRNMPGAAALCCAAAYNAGCGLVNACTVSGAAQNVQTHVQEAITTILPDIDGYLCRESIGTLMTVMDQADAVVLGPGMGNNTRTKGFLQEFVKIVKTPVVCDADALNIFAADKQLLEQVKKGGWIFTPHPGEMGRLTDTSPSSVLKDTIVCARLFSSVYNTTTLLKDSATVVSDDQGTMAYVNTTGNQAMAKAGAGDVLCGVIGGFSAQGMNPFDAAAAGAYVHGLAGDLAREALGDRGVKASDLIRFLPEALMKIEREG